MKDENEFVTEWHHYDAAHAIVEAHEPQLLALQEQIEAFSKKLRRTSAIAHARETREAVFQLRMKLSYLERMCDQHAG
jgi:hypothetical protein